MEILPSEIISYIFQFLPSFEDRKAASLVCKLWYDVLQSPDFKRDEVLKITSNEVFDELSRLTCLNRVYPHVFAHDVVINTITNPFWDKYGPYIKELTISKCDLSEKSFIYVILSCDNLESLSIVDCMGLFLSGKFLDNESDRVALKKNLHRLKRLNLSYNQYLCDAIFTRFMSICENLQELNLSGCSISCPHSLYRRFYSTGSRNPSECVFTSSVILDCIQQFAGKLKVLSLNETMINIKMLTSMVEIPNLSLQQLNLIGCVQFGTLCIETLSNFQQSLTHLDLSLCDKIKNQSLINICMRLNKLRHLSLRRSLMITDEGMSEIWRLTELSRLDLSRCARIGDEGIVMGLCKTQNKHLEELNISETSVKSDNTIVKLMEFIPNIKILDLGCLHRAVTDKAAQSIFASAKQLRSLTLRNCKYLTDKGFTGITVKSPPTTTSPKEENHYRIPLGSKEELKIVMNAKMKKEIQEICSTSDLTGASLASDLKHLHTLDLSNTSITDVTLKYGIKLEDLRTLNLSNCAEITADGLFHLCDNNKFIESLNVNSCRQVEDYKAVRAFKSLKRLKILTLSWFSHNADILDDFDDGWENLRVLDARNCPEIPPSILSRLMERRPHLKIIHSPNNYQEGSACNNIPKPPRIDIIYQFPEYSQFRPFDFNREFALIQEFREFNF